MKNSAFCHFKMVSCQLVFFFLQMGFVFKIKMWTHIILSVFAKLYTIKSLPHITVIRKKDYCQFIIFCEPCDFFLCQLFFLSQNCDFFSITFFLTFLLSIHNICFSGEIWKISILFGWKKKAHYLEPGLHKTHLCGMLEEILSQKYKKINNTLLDIQ